MLREEVLRGWRSCKEKIKNSWKEGKVVVYQDYTAPQSVNLSLVEHQYELGQILLDLEWKSLSPVADWTELAQAIHNFKSQYEEKYKYLEEELMVIIYNSTPKQKKEVHKF